MHGVVRETTYDPSTPLQERPEFQEFQEAHASQPGYRGTLVVEAGNGRYFTVTLWEGADEMADGRKAMTPIVERLLNPIFTSPPRLLGMGEVVVDDVIQPNDATTNTLPGCS